MAAKKVNKGEWMMLGMSSAGGGTTSASTGPGDKTVLVIWKWHRRTGMYTVGYNGGGNPNEHELSNARTFQTELEADAYVEEIKKSDESVTWVVKTATESPH